jgi:hypothetical protein
MERKMLPGMFPVGYIYGYRRLKFVQEEEMTAQKLRIFTFHWLYWRDKFVLPII